jgi:hypothetical protein
MSCSLAEFVREYERTRAVLLRGACDDSQLRFGLSDLRAVPAQDALRRDAAASFTVENAPLSGPTVIEGEKKRKRSTAAADHEYGPTTAEELLGGPSIPNGVWYASCIVQREPEALDALLRSIPLVAPPCLDGVAAHHSRAVWLFVGRNDSASAIAGRPEHTDNVLADGTLPLQTSLCSPSPAHERLDAMHQRWCPVSSCLDCTFHLLGCDCEFVHHRDLALSG